MSKILKVLKLVSLSTAVGTIATIGINSNINNSCNFNVEPSQVDNLVQFKSNYIPNNINLKVGETIITDSLEEYLEAIGETQKNIGNCSFSLVDSNFNTINELKGLTFDSKTGQITGTASSNINYENIKIKVNCEVDNIPGWAYSKPFNIIVTGEIIQGKDYSWAVILTSVLGSLIILGAMYYGIIAHQLKMSKNLIAQEKLNNPAKIKVKPNKKAIKKSSTKNSGLKTMPIYYQDHNKQKPKDGNSK